MTKAPQAFRTISEVSETLDVQQHVLRFWESKFPQIKPLKRAGGRRYYRPDDIELLRGIRTLLHREGYTIKGVQKLLRESGARYVCEIGRFGLVRNARAATRDELQEVSSDSFGTGADRDAQDIGGDPAAPAEDSHESADLDTELLAERRSKLEAALTELLRLRDMLAAARPKKADAA